MVDDERTSGDDAPEGPRRKTYTPPDPDAVFTGSFPVVDEAPSPQPTIAPPAPPVARSATEPPVRTSLSDEEIISRLSKAGAGSTAQMMAELERQVELREAEEEAFEMWANLTRTTRGELAEEIIRRERIIFDGGSVPEPEPEPEAEREPDPEPEPEIGAPEDDTAVNAELVEPDQGEEVIEAPAEEIGAVDEDLEHRWPMDQVEAESTTAHSSPKTAGLIWVWAVSAAPVLGIAGGAFLVSRGLHLLEALTVVAVIGVVAGLLIAGVARGGHIDSGSTAGLGRGSFGHGVGAALAVVFTLVRAGVGAILLLAALALGERVLSLSGLWPFEPWIQTALVGGVVAALAVTFATLGGAPLRIAVWSSAALAGIGVVGLATWWGITLGAAVLPSSVGWSASVVDMLGLGAVALSIVLLIFGLGAADANTLRPGSGRRSPGFSVAVGVAVPLSAVSAIGVLLAHTNPALANTFVTDPVGSITAGMPLWLLAPAFLVLVVPLVGLGALVLFGAGSGARDVWAALPRITSTLILAVIAVGAAVAAVVLDVALPSLVLGLIPGLGVLAVAWLGAVAVDGALGEARATHAEAVRFGRLVGFVASLGLGWGLVSSHLPWLGWQGYLFPVLGEWGVVDLSGTGLGIWVALVVSCSVGLTSAVLRRRRAGANA